jgi:hypothetical protein
MDDDRWPETGSRADALIKTVKRMFNCRVYKRVKLAREHTKLDRAGVYVGEGVPSCSLHRLGSKKQGN